MNNSSTWFKQCFHDLIDSPVSHWLNTLPTQMQEWQHSHHRKDVDKWCNLLNQLPDMPTANIELTTKVSIGTSEDAADGERKRITALMKHFMPWRKGPFFVHGVNIDTEWRSDWKWDRVLPHIEPLAQRTVLDVGCGSGYHMWRMLGEQAKLVIGIDPTPLFLIQFHAIKHFHGAAPIHMLPLGIEHMPELNGFDSVFSMGVLYHRRDPIQFLTELKQQLKPGGQLILETLVVEGDVNTVLMPTDRYARMRNVWFLPSCEALSLWLSRLGFVDIKVVDENVTSLDEQRKTEWMDNQSLADFLDPDDVSKTIEGYPAPKRAVIIAKKK